jgi:hypothetical protein
MNCRIKPDCHPSSTWRGSHAILLCVLVACVSPAWGEQVIGRGETASHRGVYEIALRAEEDYGNPYFDAALRVEFTRPDKSKVLVDGFYDGERTFKARAYCDTTGTWTYRTKSSLRSLDGRTGSFTVQPSDLPGKLRIHPKDPRQFAYDNGDWFLHIGDTGYRYISPTEPHWRAYFAQAVEKGATKIRVWFCQGRHDVQNLLSEDRRELNLPYWQEIDRRLSHALEHAPHVQLQLIPYGEDGPEVNRYGAGDAAAQAIAAYAQARFSALPNVQWTISNDLFVLAEIDPSNRFHAPIAVIEQIGRDMAAREPWGTLLTNHQRRWSGYAFVESAWSDIITLHDLDQAAGELILSYRPKAARPVVLDEDRYEHWREPENPRYFFRRLMWASLLSGGHATYGGLRTYEPYDGGIRGVQGYFDANRAGKLAGGADDFVHIHRFFADTGLTLVGMEPADALVGGDPHQVKCIGNGDTYIVYAANPDGKTPQSDRPRAEIPRVHIRLAQGDYSVRCYNPRTGTWAAESTISGSGPRQLETPELEPDGADHGDWVILIRKKP